MAALLTGVDVVVAAGQAQVLRSGGDCTGTACSVATLGGHPALCFALAVSAAVLLVAGTVALTLPPADSVWEFGAWLGVAASVVAGTGAVLVAAFAVVLAAVVIGFLIAGVRLLGR